MKMIRFVDSNGNMFKLYRHPFDVIRAFKSKCRSLDGGLVSKEDVKFSLKQSIVEGGVECEVDEINCVQACGDEARVPQCLRILVSNAATFAAKGKVDVTVWILRECVLITSMDH